MAARPTQQPSQAPYFIAGSIVLGAALAFVGGPAFAGPYLGLLLAAWLEPPVMLTGKKDNYGAPTPMNPGEEARLRRFAFWRSLRFRLFSPSADWLPGWPILGSWLGAVAVAGIGWSLPVQTTSMRPLNAACAFLAITAVMGARRRTMADQDVCPGARVDSLVEMARKKPQIVGPAVLAGFVVAFVVLSSVPRWSPDNAKVVLTDVATGAEVPHSATTLPPATVPVTSPEGVEIPAVDAEGNPVPPPTIPVVTQEVVLDATATKNPDSMFSGLSDYGTRTPLLAAIASGLAAMLALLAYPWTKFALEHWKSVVAARAEWRPRWLPMKIDPVPWLVDRQMVGEATVDTFMASGGTDTQSFIALTPKINTAIGAGRRVVVLTTPDEGPEGPKPGTIHSTRFEVVTSDGDPGVDLCDPSAPMDEITLTLRTGIALMADSAGYGRAELMDVQPMHAEGESRAVWATYWSFPGGPNLSTYRTDVIGDLADAFGAEVVIDPKFDTMYVGACLTDQPENWISEPPKEAKASSYGQRLIRVNSEDEWRSRWSQVLKQIGRFPDPDWGTEIEAQFGRMTLNSLSFVMKMGVAPSEFTTNGIEKQVTTALSGSTFVSITHFRDPRDRTPGSRHPQGISIRWSRDVPPASPADMPPNTDGKRGAQRDRVKDPALWLMSRFMDKAFDAGRMPRPEVCSVQCLTSDKARGHIWAVDLRFYGGTTLSDVRGRANAMRTNLAVEWLRVAPWEHGCTIYLGASPDARGTILRDEKKDRAKLISLDWEDAFLSAKCSGVGGILPRLVSTGHLPDNPQVSVLEFELPPGLDRAAINSELGKLRSATDNSFIEIHPGRTAKTMKMLVSVENPLPGSVSFDFDAVDESTCIPFATGIDGSPIEFDPEVSPHLLISGVTGGGKMEPLTNRIPVPVSERFPDGWATMGELEVTDRVFAPDGSTSLVVGLSPVTKKKTMTVVLSDGQRIDCGPDHLWKVSTAKTRNITDAGFLARRLHKAGKLEATAERLKEILFHCPTGTTSTLTEVAAYASVPEDVVRRVVPDHLGVTVTLPKSRNGGVAVDSFRFPLDESLKLLVESYEFQASNPGAPKGVFALERIVSTEEMLEALNSGSNPEFAVRLTAPLEGMENEDLPKNPYLVGSDMAVAAIPAAYRRASVGQRRELLRGLEDSRGSTDDDGGRVLKVDGRQLATDAVEVIRSLGMIASFSFDGEQAHIHYSDPAATDPSECWLHVTGIEVGAPVPMRCISVKNNEHLYLTAGFVPTHNSVLAQGILYGAVVRGWEVYVLDPIKGGADFSFMKDRSYGFGTTIFEAEGVMRHVYAEVFRRKELNKEYGTGSFRELPDDVRPPYLFLFIDEFTSLMSKKIAPTGNSPEIKEEAARINAENEAMAQVSNFVGKIAREARSAGVIMAIGAQEMKSDFVKKLPGGADLKTNMARTLMGKSSFGQVMSALRNGADAPRMEGDTPKGRGYWESMTANAEVMQVWFGTQPDFARELAKRVPPISDDRRMNMDDFVEPEPDYVHAVDSDVSVLDDLFSGELQDEDGTIPTDGEPPVVNVDLDIDIDLSLDDLEGWDDEPSGFVDDLGDIEIIDSTATSTVTPTQQPDEPGELDWDAVEADVEAVALDDGSDLDWESAFTSDDPVDNPVDNFSGSASEGVALTVKTTNFRGPQADEADATISADASENDLFEILDSRAGTFDSLILLVTEDQAVDLESAASIVVDNITVVLSAEPEPEPEPEKAVSSGSRRTRRASEDDDDEVGWQPPVRSSRRR